MKLFFLQGVILLLRANGVSIIGSLNLSGRVFFLSNPILECSMHNHKPLGFSENKAQICMQVQYVMNAFDTRGHDHSRFKVCWRLSFPTRNLYTLAR